MPRYDIIIYDLERQVDNEYVIRLSFDSEAELLKLARGVTNPSCALQLFDSVEGRLIALPPGERSMNADIVEEAEATDPVK